MADSLNLEALEVAVRAELDQKFAARELALKNCRKIIQSASKAIRALHRGDIETADALIAEGRSLIDEAEAPLSEHRDIYHAGFFYDAVKEHAEAVLTRALRSGQSETASEPSFIASVSRFGEATEPLSR